MKNLNATEVKQIAKSLKIKNWWNKKREVLVQEIAAIKGWENEKPDALEFLLAGGEITEGRPQRNKKRRPPTEKSAESNAGTKKPKRKKAKKAPAKKAPKKQPKERDANVTTLSELCEELKLEGRVARRRLRGAVASGKLTKPGDQWEWPNKKAADKKVLKQVQILLAG